MDGELEQGSSARQPVAVFGTGVMAHGIARLCLSHGYPVLILSNSPQRAQHLRSRLAHEVHEQAAAGPVSADYAELEECEVFVEATVEALDVKHRVLREVEPRVPSDAVIATTTSSLSITRLGSALERPERFLGLHFFNPVHRMKLVEVVRGMRTSGAALSRGEAFVETLGKHPLRIPDQAGFLVNRLLIPYLNRAAWMVDAGVASIEDIDRAMVAGAGHPLGPLALIDLIGADVAVAIGRSLHEETNRPGDSPPSGLQRRAVSGWLGRKTGQGYHAYPRHRQR
jgi:3-hydroxybutyryl-CoA dehydrogenase